MKKMSPPSRAFDVWFVCWSTNNLYDIILMVFIVVTGSKFEYSSFQPRQCA